MSKPQANPFKFGDPVEGDYYLPRPNLSKLLTEYVTNRIHVVLIGPRRFGKTSFVLNLLQNLTQQSYICPFVDIFNITSHRDFLQQMIRALHKKQGWWDKLKSQIQSLRPCISLEADPTKNYPVFNLSATTGSSEDVKEAIQNVLSSLAALGNHVVLAIDEFQKIAELDDQGWLEATLRTHMQQLRNTSFLFTGSRQSLIAEMLNDHARPLYRSCQSVIFPSFGDEFTDWVIERFASVAIRCERKAIAKLRQMVHDTPNYVQMVCFHLVAQGIEVIGEKEIVETLRMVVRQNAYAYQTLLNSLPPAQQRALRLAANNSTQVFQQQLLKRYEIASAPALASSINALKKKGILDEEGTGRGSMVFDDPLFAIWLKDSFN
jgi:hypothetical protein